MTKDDYDLGNIIKSSFEESIEYFNKNDIKIEGLKLRIVKSICSLYDIFILLFVCQGNLGLYFPNKKIFIIKKQLEKTVNRILDDLSHHNIKDSSIIGIKLSKNSIISYPFYVDMRNIKNNIMKTVTDTVVVHEIGHAILHFIGGNNERGASFLEFLVYFYKNELYKYPEVYEIMEENVEICEEYIKKENPLSPYSLGSRLAPYSFGSCFANDIIYAYENVLNKDKQSPKLNIKDMIEKLKFFSKDYYVEITKKYNETLKDYIDASKTLNVKYGMLSWMTNCLLEKPPNMINNI